MKIVKVLAQHVSRKDVLRDWIIEPAEDLEQAAAHFKKASGLEPKEFGYDAEGGVIIRFEYPKPRASRLD